MRLAWLLGRPDHPTDGVEDYCRLLGAELTRRGHSLALVRLRWDEHGWARALLNLTRDLGAFRPDWTLMHFTHLMWSRHGFSHPALAVALLSRRLAPRTGIVLHDPFGFSGGRLRDKVRRRTQHAVMRGLARLAHRTLVTVSPSRLPWASDADRRGLILLPVGSIATAGYDGQRSGTFTVATFGVTEGANRAEIGLLGQVLRTVAHALGPVKFVLVGRGSGAAASSLRAELAGSRVELDVRGLVSPEEVGRTLSCADAMLFVRGGISSRRSSVIAGIACGLPIVGVQTEETDWPVTEAGVVLAPAANVEALASGLIRIARDRSWAEELRVRSRTAHGLHFDWRQIAHRLETALS